MWMVTGNTGASRPVRAGRSRASAVWQSTGTPVSRDTASARAAPLRTSAGVVSPHRWVLFTRPEQVSPVVSSMALR